MNIKSLLLGTAAALVAATAVNAADAIVVAEAEPMEYVRVCDAFGTGYFYIPGTETCLRVGGFVRFETSFAENDNGSFDRSDLTRAHVSFDAKSDTEWGTLQGFAAIELDASTSAETKTVLDEAYIQLGGLKAGNFYSWWDKGINGETDTLGNVTKFNALAYVYDGGTFQLGASVDGLVGSKSKKFVETAKVDPDAGKKLPGGKSSVDPDGKIIVLPGSAEAGNSGDKFTNPVESVEGEWVTTQNPNTVGFAGFASASIGGVTVDLLGGYDTEADDGAIRALLSADLGPGVFQAAGVWASGASAYWNASEWSVAASYRWAATDKLGITPAVQYWDSVNFDKDVDQWRGGLTVDYALTEGLDLLTTVNYTEVSKEDGRVSGFVRLQRNF